MLISSMAERHAGTSRQSRSISAAVAATMLDTAIVTIACVVFLALCLYQIDLPGLYADEAFDVIPAMQIVLGHPVELQRNIGLHLFGLDLPLMSSSDYQGVTSTYMVLPFFALGGVNVVSLRLMTVMVGVIGVILTYFLARVWFGRGSARLAVLLIAVSPAWVFWSRLGVYVVSQVMPIAVGALLAFTAWVRSEPLEKRNRALYLGAFLLGLGLTTKLLFLWFILAVAIVALILWGRPLWESRRDWLVKRGQWLRTALVGGFWFMVGASPFLTYNILSGGTFNLLRHTVSAPGSTSHGVNNSAFLRNLWTEVDAFKVLLDGGYFWFQGVASAIYSNPLTPAFFALSALGLVCLLLTEKRATGMTLTALPRPGVILLVGALLIALMLSSNLLGGTIAGLLVMLAGLLCAVGVLWLVRTAIANDAAWTSVGWLLITSTTATGALWWFGGAGRPEGAAPGSFLGLWPIDAAGVVFWITGTGLIFLLGIDRRPVPYQRAITATLALIGLIVAQSSVTVSGLWATHLLILLPLPQITIAAFALLAGKRLAGRFAAQGQRVWRTSLQIGIAVILVGAPILFDLRVARSYHRDLALTGGAATFSDAIYSLADYLDKQTAKPRIVALDWGFKRPVQLLTHDRINPEDAYGYEEPPSPTTTQAIADLVKQPNTLFLFHTQEAGIAYPRYDLFAAAAHDLGKQPVLERVFYQRDGIPVYRVYSVR